MERETTPRSGWLGPLTWFFSGAPLLLAHLMALAWLADLGRTLANSGAAFTLFKVTLLALVLSSLASWPVWWLAIRNTESLSEHSRNMQTTMLLAGSMLLVVLALVGAIR